MAEKVALVTGAGRSAGLGGSPRRQITALAEKPGDVGAPAYSFAKHTLNQLGAMVAATFRDTRVLVNTVDPGRADTHPELGAGNQDQPPSVAAGWIVKAATLPDGGPTGAIFLDGIRVG